MPGPNHGKSTSTPPKRNKNSSGKSSTSTTRPSAKMRSKSSTSSTPPPHAKRAASIKGKEDNKKNAPATKKNALEKTPVAAMKKASVPVQKKPELKEKKSTGTSDQKPRAMKPELNSPKKNQISNKKEVVIKSPAANKKKGSFSPTKLTHSPKVPLQRRGLQKSAVNGRSGKYGSTVTPPPMKSSSRTPPLTHRRTLSGVAHTPKTTSHRGQLKLRPPTPRGSHRSSTPDVRKRWCPTTPYPNQKITTTTGRSPKMTNGKRNECSLEKKSAEGSDGHVLAPGQKRAVSPTLSQRGAAKKTDTRVADTRVTDRVVREKSSGNNNKNSPTKSVTFVGFKKSTVESTRSPLRSTSPTTKSPHRKMPRTPKKVGAFVCNDGKKTRSLMGPPPPPTRGSKKVEEVSTTHAKELGGGGGGGDRGQEAQKKQKQKPNSSPSPSPSPKRNTPSSRGRNSRHRPEAKNIPFAPPPRGVECQAGQVLVPGAMPSRAREENVGGEESPQMLGEPNSSTHTPNSKVLGYSRLSLRSEQRIPRMCRTPEGAFSTSGWKTISASRTPLPVGVKTINASGTPFPVGERYEVVKRSRTRTPGRVPKERTSAESTMLDLPPQSLPPTPRRRVRSPTKSEDEDTLMLEDEPEMHEEVRRGRKSRKEEMHERGQHGSAASSRQDVVGSSASEPQTPVGKRKNPILIASNRIGRYQPRVTGAGEMSPVEAGAIPPSPGAVGLAMSSTASIEREHSDRDRDRDRDRSHEARTARRLLALKAPIRVAHAERTRATRLGGENEKGRPTSAPSSLRRGRESNSEPIPFSPAACRTPLTPQEGMKSRKKNLNMQIIDIRADKRARRGVDAPNGGLGEAKVGLVDHHTSPNHEDRADRPILHAAQASRRHAPVLKLGIKRGSTYVKKICGQNTRTSEREKDEELSTQLMIESSKKRREQDASITEDKDDVGPGGSGGESSNRSSEHTTQVKKRGAQVQLRGKRRGHKQQQREQKAASDSASVEEEGGGGGEGEGGEIDEKNENPSTKEGRPLKIRAPRGAPPTRVGKIKKPLRQWFTMKNRKTMVGRPVKKRHNIRAVGAKKRQYSQEAGDVSMPPLVTPETVASSSTNSAVKTASECGEVNSSHPSIVASAPLPHVNSPKEPMKVEKEPKPRNNLNMAFSPRHHPAPLVQRAKKEEADDETSRRTLRANEGKSRREEAIAAACMSSYLARVRRDGERKGSSSSSQVVSPTTATATSGAMKLNAPGEERRGEEKKEKEAGEGPRDHTSSLTRASSPSIGQGKVEVEEKSVSIPLKEESTNDKTAAGLGKVGAEDKTTAAVASAEKKISRAEKETMGSNEPGERAITIVTEGKDEETKEKMESESESSEDEKEKKDEEEGEEEGEETPIKIPLPTFDPNTRVGAILTEIVTGAVDDFEHTRASRNEKLEPNGAPILVVSEAFLKPAPQGLNLDHPEWLQAVYRRLETAVDDSQNRFINRCSVMKIKREFGTFRASEMNAYMREITGTGVHSSLYLDGLQKIHLSLKEGLHRSQLTPDGGVDLASETAVECTKRKLAFCSGENIMNSSTLPCAMGRCMAFQEVVFSLLNRAAGSAALFARPACHHVPMWRIRCALCDSADDQVKEVGCGMPGCDLMFHKPCIEIHKQMNPGKVAPKNTRNQWICPFHDPDSPPRPNVQRAEDEVSCGFSYINATAYSLRRAQALFPKVRMAVVDIDVHHGNGNQSVFYDDPQVLVISMHRGILFCERTGTPEFIGVGKGKGFNINIPLELGDDDEVALMLFHEIILPLLRQFVPHLVVVALGFDALDNSKFKLMQRLTQLPSNAAQEREGTMGTTSTGDDDDDNDNEIQSQKIGEKSAVQRSPSVPASSPSRERPEPSVNDRTTTKEAKEGNANYNFGTVPGMDCCFSPEVYGDLVGSLRKEFPRVCLQSEGGYDPSQVGEAALGCVKSLLGESDIKITGHEECKNKIAAAKMDAIQARILALKKPLLELGWNI